MMTSSPKRSLQIVTVLLILLCVFAPPTRPIIELLNPPKHSDSEDHQCATQQNKKELLCQEPDNFFPAIPGQASVEREDSPLMSRKKVPTIPAIPGQAWVEREDSPLMGRKKVPTNSNCYVAHGEQFFLNKKQEQHIKRCNDHEIIATGSRTAGEGDDAVYRYTVNKSQRFCGTSARRTKNGQSLKALKDCLQNMCKNFKELGVEGYPPEGPEKDNNHGAEGIYGPQQEVACEKKPFQMTFTEKKTSRNQKRKTIVVRFDSDPTFSSNKLKAYSVSRGGCFSVYDEKPVGSLTFGEFFLDAPVNSKMRAAEGHWKSIASPLMNLQHFISHAPPELKGVGSMLFFAYTSFLKKSADGEHWGLIIYSAGQDGPTFYHKIGFKMVGDYVYSPTETTPDQKALKIRYEEVAKDKLSSAWPIAMRNHGIPPHMVMYGELNVVHEKLERGVQKFWKIRNN
jgi:hypothetical protein